MHPNRALGPSLAVILWSLAWSACAGHQPRPTVLPPGGGAPAAAIARTAESLQGSPYRDGGAGPDGFDCSGLVSYVYSRYGVSVPRGVKRQASAGREVPRADIRPGDLLFFETVPPGPSHVAIALDQNRFVHAPKSGAVVRIESLRSAYWSRRLLFGRRITR
jgi:cell wall-associated NlpC family hydrolase